MALTQQIHPFQKSKEAGRGACGVAQRKEGEFSAALLGARVFNPISAIAISLLTMSVPYGFWTQS